MVAAGEVAFPALPQACRRPGHPVAVHADVRAAVAGPDRDRGGLAAGPARGGWPRFPAAAPLADGAAAALAPATGLTCRRGAGGGELPARHGLHMPPPRAREAACRSGRRPRTPGRPAWLSRGRSARWPAARRPAARRGRARRDRRPAPRRAGRSACPAGATASTAAANRAAAVICRPPPRARRPAPGGSTGRPRRPRPASSCPAGHGTPCRPAVPVMHAGPHRAGQRRRGRRAGPARPAAAVRRAR